MGVGLGVMRLSPATFWAMTPREFTAAVRGLVPPAAPRFRRTRLDELMQTYPDL
jgi:uncharacterized phage protein (TIGR02216 family)